MKTIVDLAGEPATEDEPVGQAVIDESSEAQALPERARRNDDGTITLSLRRPVVLAVRSASGKTTETTYDELVFHELFGADMRAVTNAKDDQRIDVLLSRALKTSQPVARALFDKLVRKDAEDAAAVASFL